jgi:hypothetical protein
MYTQSRQYVHIIITTTTSRLQRVQLKLNEHAHYHSRTTAISQCSEIYHINLLQNQFNLFFALGLSDILQFLFSSFHISIAILRFSHDVANKD